MRPRLILNDDGWSTYMRHPAPMSPEGIVQRTVGPLAGTAVNVFQFCGLGGHAVQYKSSFLPRIGDMLDRVDQMHVWRMRETLRHLDELGTDPLHVVAGACRDNRIACQFSLRMNDRHHCYRLPDGSYYFPELLSPWLDTHPELLMADRSVNYCCPGAYAYRRRQIEEVLDNYAVDGIDLDFTRFKPWFPAGEEETGRPLMTAFLRKMRELTASRGKVLSARFAYDPQDSLACGLDVETWLAEGLLDFLTLGGGGDHTPDAPSAWWIERAHAKGCGVFPCIEGQLHWFVASGGGGAGLHPGDGVVDGYGPPSMAYMRAVAAIHYEKGADGICLYNFTCADGPFPRSAFTELAQPSQLRGRSKQYVMTLWPNDFQIYIHPWRSNFVLEPHEDAVQRTLFLADDFTEPEPHPECATLTLDLMGVNRLTDLEITFNGTRLYPCGPTYNHYDHGYWNDIVPFAVPLEVLRPGENAIGLRRLVPTPHFDGAIQVRKCVLDVSFPESVSVGGL